MNILDEIKLKVESDMNTGTVANMGYCGYRLPCGMCSYLRQPCLKEPRKVEVTCDGSTNERR